MKQRDAKQKVCCNFVIHVLLVEKTFIKRSGISREKCCHILLIGCCGQLKKEPERILTVTPGLNTFGRTIHFILIQVSFSSFLFIPVAT